METKEDMKNEEKILKPCFRCKSTNVDIKNYGSDGKIGVCNNCGLMSPWKETFNKVVIWWNERKQYEDE